MGAPRLAAMVAVVALMAVFFGFMIFRFSSTEMAALYSDLTMEDSSAIVQELEGANVEYELVGDGSTIRIPKDEVLRWRMRLAENGLPSGGAVGYEIFDRSNTLGATSFVQNINHIRALEGELSRTIRSIDRITAARVHLVIPERALFSREQRQPSASIALRVRGALEPGQIRAIQHLVASAVDGLKPSSVSIVDEAGQLLASGTGDEETAAMEGFEERRVSYEHALANRVDEIVGSVVGPGRARVQVAVELDLNRITETQDLFDPENQVVRSSQTRTEETAQAGRTGEVSVGTQLPGSNTDQSANPTDMNSVEEETLNYEISRRTRTEVTEAGGVKRLSVAVLVDGTYATDGSNQVTYTPRSQEELDRIAALVRSAVGFDQQRGDQVEIVNLRFAAAPPQEEAVEDTGFFGLGIDREDLFRLAELAVAGLVGLLLVFFGVRPLVRRVVAPDTPQVESGVGTAMLAIAPPPSLPVAGQPGQVRPLNFAEDVASETALQIERARQTGALHADTIRKVGAIIEDNPNEAVSIVRSWLSAA